MDEAKSLIHHALAAMFASLILVAVMSLITLGNMMWRAFADQAESNRRLEEYAKYAAFDNQEVRGQDIISLIHDTVGTPFIAIVGPSSTNHNQYMPIHTTFTNTDLGFNLKNTFTSLGLQGMGNIETLGDFAEEIDTNFDPNNPINKVMNDDPNNPETLPKIINNCSHNTPLSYTELQAWFLNRGYLHSNVSGYMPYKSYLIYEDDYSTDIVGILFIELNN